MGYYTRFNLKWKDESAIGKPTCEHAERAGNKFCPMCGIEVGVFTASELIVEYLEKRNGDFCGIDSGGDSTDTVKWYDHETNMRELSKEFPSVVFTLHGEGEESGDFWNKYFLGGKMQLDRPELVYAGFDKSKLA